MATSETRSDPPDPDGDEDDEDAPAIDEDLIKEELRIDGICGVY